MSFLNAFEGKLSRFFMLCALALSAWPNSLSADDVAGVQSKLESESPVWVGQKVSFSIKLLSSTFFSGTPHFDLPNVPCVIIMKSQGPPVVGSEKANGETWSSQLHSFSLYAHRPGNYVIPSFPVRFAVASAFGKPPEEQRLTTQAVSFEAKLPPGAEGLSLLISTSNLQVDEVWSPSVAKDGKINLEVGDAITRKITLRAVDVPGMALPSIELPDPSGLSTYPRKPIVTDKENRGDHTGQRIESTTYVCESPGEVTLPTVVIPWWNTESNILEKVTLPSLSISVVEPEHSVDAVTPGDENKVQLNSESNLGLLLGSLAVLLTAWLVWHFQILIWDWFETEASKADRLEASQFSRVLAACSQNEPLTTLNALMGWLEIRSSGTAVVTIREFLATLNDPILARELESLQRAAMDPKQPWSGQGLAQVLSRVRKRNRSERRRWRDFRLAPLNPTDDRP